jgi:hypothetical protein
MLGIYPSVSRVGAGAVSSELFPPWQALNIRMMNTMMSQYFFFIDNFS